MTAEGRAQAKLRALLVEDQEALLLRVELQRLPRVELRLVHTLAEALEELKHGEIDVALLDLDLADGDGLETLAALRAASEELPLVVFTDEENEDLGARALEQGAHDYLEKEGLEPRILRRSMQYAVLRARQWKQLRQTAALREANEDLRQLERARNQFINILAHELRTPLHAIVGYSELVHAGAYGELSTAQAEALGGVVRRGRDLVEILENVLNLSRIESGRLQVQPDIVDPAEVLGSSLDTARQLVELRSSPVRIEFDTFAAPRAVRRDPRLYARIISNLLTNAVRYTNAGWVSVTLEQRGKRFVTIVEDTGRGIPKEKQTIVFDPFRQVADAREREPGSTGLGLTIALRLADKLGGTLTLESEVGEGSRFELDLPLFAAPDLIADAGEPTPL